MGSILSGILTNAGAVLKTVASGPYGVFWVLFTPLRWVIEFFLWILGWGWFFLSMFFQILVGILFTVRSVGTGVSKGAGNLNTKLENIWNSWFSVGLARRGQVKLPWVFLAGLLKVLKTVVRWVFDLMGATWQAFVAILAFILVIVAARIFAEPLMWFETNPQEFYNLSNVFIEAIVSIYTLFGGTWNSYIDTITPFQPLFDYNVAFLWQFLAITAEAVVVSVFGNQDLGSLFGNILDNRSARLADARFFQGRNLLKDEV